MERAHAWHVWALSLVIALGGSGCVETTDEYAVRMRPISGGLERRITAGIVHPSEALPRLMAAYRVRSWRDSTRFEARATFHDTLPSDVGGWGRVARRVSPLGETWLYVESFRGDPDPGGRVERCLATVDSATALLFGWLRHERPGDPRLSLAAESRVRAALRTLSVHIWRTPLVGDMSDLYAILLVGDRLAWPIRARRPRSDDPISDPPDLMDPLSLARMVVGVDRKGASMPGYLANADSLQASLARYLNARGDWPAPPTGKELEQFLSRIQNIATRADTLHVELSLAVRPYSTNGLWNDSSRVVAWSTYLTDGPDDPQPPFYCGASWSIPNRVRQQRLFGRVVLAGEDLDKYCQERAELSSNRMSEWDRMVETLRPGRLQPLEEFRFADERAARISPTHSAASDLRELLQRAITSSRSEHPETSAGPVPMAPTGPGTS